MVLEKGKKKKQTKCIEIKEKGQKQNDRRVDVSWECPSILYIYGTQEQAFFHLQPFLFPSFLNYSFATKWNIHVTRHFLQHVLDITWSFSFIIIIIIYIFLLFFIFAFHSVFFIIFFSNPRSFNSIKTPSKSRISTYPLTSK